MDRRANHPTMSSVLRAVSSNCKLPYATRLRSTWMLVLPHAGGALCALRASSSRGGDRMARATPTRVQTKRHHTYQGPGQAAPHLPGSRPSGTCDVCSTCGSKRAYSAFLPRSSCSMDPGLGLASERAHGCSLPSPLSLASSLASSWPATSPAKMRAPNT